MCILNVKHFSFAHTVLLLIQGSPMCLGICNDSICEKVIFMM